MIWARSRRGFKLNKFYIFLLSCITWSLICCFSGCLLLLQITCWPLLPVDHYYLLTCWPLLPVDHYYLLTITMKFPNFPGLEKGTSAFPNSPKLFQSVLTLPHLLTAYTFSWADTVTQLDCEMSTARDSTQPVRLLWKQDQQQDNDINSTDPLSLIHISEPTRPP